MIERVQIQNYKALQDVLINLTPIHVLIGPNDSGKTSILEAVAALCRSVDEPLPNCFTGSWSGRQLVNHNAKEPIVNLAAAGHDDKTAWQYRLACQFDQHNRNITKVDEFASVDDNPIAATMQGYSQTAVMRTMNQSAPQEGFQEVGPLIHAQLSGVQYYRWIPRFLSLPVAPDSTRKFRMETSGFGLALFLDDILGYDREAFDRLEKEFRGLFPQFRSLKLLSEPAFKTNANDPEQIPRLQSAEGKGIYLQYSDDWLVPAAQLSDGVLLILAYLAILHAPKPPRMLLVEEPENGIHPTRLRQLIDILRRLVKGQDHTQILLTTHSPYVVDLFEPDEVTLCGMQDNGSVGVRRLSDSSVVLKQAQFFTLGEIWTGEGDDVLTKSPAVPVGAAN